MSATGATATNTDSNNAHANPMAGKTQSAAVTSMTKSGIAARGTGVVGGAWAVGMGVGVGAVAGGLVL